jgi:hypothetical protein
MAVFGISTLNQLAKILPYQNQGQNIGSRNFNEINSVIPKIWTL